VKPARFDYHAPVELEEALELRSSLGQDGVPLAGGQSLLPLLGMRAVTPRALIDLRRIDSLAGIEGRNGTVSVGAMTRQRVTERSELVADGCPLLGQALSHVATPAIRNRGTVGGSIAFGDAAGELPAAAVALDAELVLRSAAGERTLPASEFFLGPSATALEPSELLTEIRFRVAGPRSGSSFLEIAPRSVSRAIVGVAAVVRLDDRGRVADSRLVFSGVGGGPVRARDAEATLRGADPGEGVFAEAAGRAASELQPPSDVLADAAYRRRAAAALARRALEHAAAVALGPEGGPP
jgi:carbon-monoxide dehydrogenase medium subunit